MRKRDKKKERARAEALAKKRKEIYTDVVVGSEGKRGKGRRQRVSIVSFPINFHVSSLKVWLNRSCDWQSRKIAAQKKKEAEREKLESRTAEQKAGDL